MQTYRVCFGDTDAGGIVYHARYFEMAERSRNETLRDAGVPIGDLFLGKLVEAAGDGIALVLHRGRRSSTRRLSSTTC